MRKVFRFVIYISDIIPFHNIYMFSKIARIICRNVTCSPSFLYLVESRIAFTGSIHGRLSSGHRPGLRPKEHSPLESGSKSQRSPRGHARSLSEGHGREGRGGYGGRRESVEGEWGRNGMGVLGRRGLRGDE